MAQPREKPGYALRRDYRLRQKGFRRSYRIGTTLRCRPTKLSARSTLDRVGFSPRKGRTDLYVRYDRAMTGIRESTRRYEDWLAVQLGNEVVQSDLEEAREDARRGFLLPARDLLAMGGDDPLGLRRPF